MQLIDGYYLYELGHKIHALVDVILFPSPHFPQTTNEQTLSKLYPAIQALDELMTRSVYKLPTVEVAATNFRDLMFETITHCEEEVSDGDFPNIDQMIKLQTALRDFESVFKATLSTTSIFLVQQKAAFDTNTLIRTGHLAFPSSLVDKVPEAVEDLNQAMRCIAFELPTASAFHLHRANEIVLGTYWDAVMQGADRPKNQTLGAYLGELAKVEMGAAPVRAALKDIKDMHRNPTIHANQTLASVEEAIDLYGAIRSAISGMLSEIPDPELQV